MTPVLDIRGLTVSYGSGKPGTRRPVVRGVDLAVPPGAVVALVGESGSGKSSTIRGALGLVPVDAGESRIGGVDLLAASRRERQRLRSRVQMVFQDPYSSLDPLATIADVVGEPFEVHERMPKRERDERVVGLLEQVGLGATHLRRYPAEFSGGQRQRIAIARALALNPKLIVCDEPVSALDVSTQAQVVNLLEDLQATHGLAYLFIAHDLAVVRHLAHRVAVMYLGSIVEYGEADTVFEHPAHPYTQALLSAVPVPDPRLLDPGRRRILRGEIPSPADPPSGCSFRTRCWRAEERCAVERPVLEIRTPSGASSACHFAAEDASPVVASGDGGGGSR